MRAKKKTSSAAAAIRVRKSPSKSNRAQVGIGGLVLPAAIGRAGMRVVKREGDGATPIASMRLLYGYYRADRLARPATRLELKPIRPDMLWCDAPAHGLYNRPARAPFSASHEQLSRSDHIYDICLVMDFNITSRRRNRGSAIFLHLARPGYLPTEGCIAVSLADMKRLLAVVKKGTMVKVER